jgi:hypothetical protein
MKFNKLSWAALALAAVSASAPQSAIAAYAYSFVDVAISNFSIAPSAGVSLVTPRVQGLGIVGGGGAADAGFCDSAFGATCDLTSATFGPAAAVQVGTGGAIANDNFIPQELVFAEFARADGVVPNNTAARDLAEAKSASNFVFAGLEGFTLNSGVTIGPSGGTLGFSFDAAVDAVAKLFNGAVPGSNAQFSLNFVIRLTDQIGTIVFEWDPDGAAGNIIGGFETADSFDLNTSVSQVNIDGQQTLSLGPSPFIATTFNIGVGTYNLAVNFPVAASAQFVPTDAPAPATLALLGFGLAGIGAARVRFRVARCR